ncbi:MAG: ECF transporter S component [Acholeplasmataceae bacterium]
MWDFIKENGQAFKTGIAIMFAIVAFVLLYLAYKYEKRTKNGVSPVKKMAATSILATLSIILYYFIKIPINLILPFMPGFFDIHFSSVPIYIGGFMFGPLTGALITVLRMLAKLPGTSTAGVGELADFIIGLMTVLVSSFIYHRHKTKKGSIVSLASSVGVWVIVALIANWLFILPFYITLFSFETVYAMLAIIPGITRDNYMLYYLLIAVIPFNLIISSLNSLITFLVYKRVSIAYDNFGFFENQVKKEIDNNKE